MGLNPQQNIPFRTQCSDLTLFMCNPNHGFESTTKYFFSNTMLRFDVVYAQSESWQRIHSVSNNLELAFRTALKISKEIGTKPI